MDVSRLRKEESALGMQTNQHSVKLRGNFGKVTRKYKGERHVRPLNDLRGIVDNNRRKSSLRDTRAQAPQKISRTMESGCGDRELETELIVVRDVVIRAWRHGRSPVITIHSTLSTLPSPLRDRSSRPTSISHHQARPITDNAA